MGERQQSPASTLAAAALEVLTCAEPLGKCGLTYRHATAWLSGQLTEVGQAAPPERPARPALPVLRQPRDMPRRKLGKDPAGRIALLHALAHIELNAIDLAWDIIARFQDEALPRGYYDDWVSVAGEEAKHFALLAARLGELGAGYGDLPAHDGLWQAARDTADDLLARLAVVPLVLEARGLDVTPSMIARLTAVGDQASAEVLQVIYRDEIGHVAIGKRWFDFVAERRQLEPESAWRDLVRQRFKGRLKGPFNEEARAAAGFPAAFYRPLTETQGG